MSTFQVRLNQGWDPNPANSNDAQARGGQNRLAQGALDTAIGTGIQVTGNQITGTQTYFPSIQRQMYAMGPNKTSRKLKDGSIFSDVNYWKRFSYPTLPVDQAFVFTLNDDGSVWNDFGPNSFIKTYSFTVLHGGGTHFVDVLGDNGNAASFAMIQTVGTAALSVSFNGAAAIILAGGTTTIFDNGDILITSINFTNNDGAVDETVTIVLSILNVAKS